MSGEQVVYQYDALNRLIEAHTQDNQNVTQWGQGYVYDGFGNLYQKNVTKGSAPSMSFTVDASTNRLTSTGSPAFTYDANGNELGGPNVSGYLSYDFLNRLTQSASTYYGYDASNRRIYKMTVLSRFSIQEAYYLYGLDGENLGTYTPTYTASPASFTLTLAESRMYFFGKKLWTTEDNVGSAASTAEFLSVRRTEERLGDGEVRFRDVLAGWGVGAGLCGEQVLLEWRGAVLLARTSARHRVQRPAEL